MLPMPVTGAPSRARLLPRVVAPAAVVALVCSGLAAGAIVAASPAAAAATVGTYPIGAAPVALNQPSDPEMGVLKPAADAAERGMFGSQVAWPIIPLHAAIARDGHLISYGTPLDSAAQGGLTYDNWDVSAGFARTAHADVASMTDYNAFCNSLTQLPDGRFVMVGGNSTMSTMLYDPSTGAQAMGENLAQARWYASSIRLTDGRVLVTGGGDYYNTNAWTTPGDSSRVATTPEIGTGTGAWTPLTGATSTYAFGAEDNRWWYPRVFNSPNGGVVGMSGDHIWSLSTSGTGSVEAIGTLPYNPRVSGSQVMFAPGRILVAGGGQNNNDDGAPATDAAAVVDVSGATATAVPTASMASARNWLNLTVLPTGEVLANGGTKVGMGLDGTGSVKQAEVWSPTTGQWRAGATAQRTRTYHSTTLLMPSGAVFTGGGGSPGPEDNLNAELFYPSYLFTRGADGTVRWASRPAISAISGSATYGGKVALTIDDGRAIASASLISSPSVTHGENTDQRRIPLTITSTGGTVTATLPASVDTMPPGDYELTVVDAAGVPSAAQLVTIRNGAAGLVTVGSDAQATYAGTPVTTTPTASGTAETAPAAPVGTTTVPGAAPVAPTAPGAGTGTGTGTTPGGSVPLTVDRSVGLEPVNRFGSRVLHVGTKIRVATVATGSTSSRGASSWTVRPGLSSARGVSFESVDRPGRYLAVPAKGTGAVVLAGNDGTKRFAARATFTAVTGATGQNRTFQLRSRPSVVLRQSGTALIAQRLDRSDRGRGDSTFAVRAGLTAAKAVPLSTGRSVGLEVADGTTARLGHAGTKVSLRAVPASAAAAAASSWVVRKGLGAKDGISFEAVDRPGWFLAAPTGGSGTPTLARRTGSRAFAARATFTAVTGVAGRGTTLRSAKRPSVSLVRAGAGAALRPVGASEASRSAATFVVRSGLAPAPAR